MKTKILTALLLATARTDGAANAHAYVHARRHPNALVGVSDVAIAPDGKEDRLRRLASEPQRGRIRSHADALRCRGPNAASSDLRSARDLGSPAWSPDGTRIAFIAAKGDDDDAQDQIFVMDMRGGDPQPVTAAPRRRRAVRVAPDGGAIAYVASRAPRKQDARSSGTSMRSSSATRRTTIAPPRAQPTFGSSTPTVAARDSSSPPVPSAYRARSRRARRGRRSRGRPTAKRSRSPRCRTPTTPTPIGRRRATSTLRAATSRSSRRTASSRATASFSPDGAHIAYWYPLKRRPRSGNDIFVAPAAGGDGTDVTTRDRHQRAARHLDAESSAC